jgi:hypothetical protein
LLLPLAKNSGKEQTTDAPTAQKAAGNQNARKAVILTATFFLFAALVLFFVPLAQEMGKEQTTHAPTAQKAASSQLADNLLVVSAALHFVIWTTGYPLFQ